MFESVKHLITITKRYLSIHSHGYIKMPMLAIFLFLLNSIIQTAAQEYAGSGFEISPWPVFDLSPIEDYVISPFHETMEFYGQTAYFKKSLDDKFIVGKTWRGLSQVFPGTGIPSENPDYNRTHFWLEGYSANGRIYVETNEHETGIVDSSSDPYFKVWYTDVLRYRHGRYWGNFAAFRSSWNAWYNENGSWNKFYGDGKEHMSMNTYEYAPEEASGFPLYGNPSHYPIRFKFVNDDKNTSDEDVSQFYLQFIKDETPPLVSVIQVEKIEDVSSEILYLKNAESPSEPPTYYFNPTGEIEKLRIYFNKPEDQGSNGNPGVGLGNLDLYLNDNNLRIKVDFSLPIPYSGWSLTYYSIVNKTDLEYTSINEIRQNTCDKLLNNANSYAHVIPDGPVTGNPHAGLPVVEDVEYAFELVGNGNQYKIICTFTGTDPSNITGVAGSGIKTASIVSRVELTEEEQEKIIENESTFINDPKKENGYVYTAVFERGFVLPSPILRVEDNVGNIKEISLEDGFKAFIRQTQIGSIEIGLDGNNEYSLTYSLFLDKNFADNTVGIKEIYIKNKVTNAVQRIFDVTKDAGKPVARGDGIYVFNGSIYREQLGNFFSYISGDVTLEVITVLALKKDGKHIEEVIASPPIPQPNIPLNNVNNDVSIRLLNADDAIVGSYDFADLETAQVFYLNETWELQLVTVSDINSNSLALKLGTAGTIVDKIQISSDISSDELRVCEYQGSELIAQYPLKWEFVYDVEQINLSDIGAALYEGTRELKGSNIYVNKGPDEIRLSSAGDELAFVDESGLDFIQVYLKRAATESSGTLLQALQAPVDIQGNTLVIDLPASAYPMSELTEGATHFLHVVFTDKAGNVSSLADMPFVYDTTPVQIPSGLSAFTVEGEYTDYTYTHAVTEDSGTLSLSIKLGEWDEIVSGSLYQISATIPAADTTNGFTLTGSPVIINDVATFTVNVPAGFQSNTQKSLALTVADPAGNSANKDIIYYTPIKLSGSANQYLAAGVSAQVGPDAYSLSWGILNSSPELVLYKNNSGVLEEINREPAGSAIFVAQDLKAHESNTYRICGTNDSGFVSSTFGYIEFDEQVANSPPQITSIAYSYRHAADGTAYLGPLSTVIIQGTDTDAGDELQFRLVAGIDRTVVLSEFTTLDAAGTVVGIQLIEENYPGYQEGDEYHLAIEYKDLWGAGEEGVALFYDLEPFVYDASAPVLSYTLDVLSGYEYTHDGISVSLTDELSGFGTGTFSCTDNAVSEAVPVVSSLAVENYFHLPESNNLKLIIEFNDHVGNQNVFTLENVICDHTAPEIINSTIAGNTKERYYSASLQIPVAIEWRDATTGIRKAEVNYYIDQEYAATREFFYASSQNFLVDSGLITEYISIDQGIITGTSEVTLEVKLYDWAGNVNSSWTSIDTAVIIDLHKPALTISGQDIFAVVNGRKYLRELSALTRLSPIVEDENAGGEVLWYLDAGSSEYTGNLIDVVGNIADDGTYTLWVESTDLAGNAGASDAISFVLDRTAPVFTNTHPTSFSKDLHPGETILLDLPASDINGIAGFTLWAGIAGESEASLSSLLDGNSNGELWIAGDSDYELIIPNVVPGRYIVKLKAHDVCGNVSAYSVQYDLTITIPDDYLVVRDARRFWNNACELRAAVEYFGKREVSLYQYRIKRIAADGSQDIIVPWQETALSVLTESFTDRLIENARYSFEVRAQCTDGYWVESVQSVGAVVDSTPPAISDFSAPSFIAQDAVSISWDIEEINALAELTLRFERYRRDATGNFVVEEINGEEYYQKDYLGTVSLLPETQGANVSLAFPENGDPSLGDRCVLSLCAIDAAGNIQEYSSLVVSYDDTKPIIPAVLDQGEFLNPLYNSLSFSLDGYIHDGESGIDKVYYQLVVGNQVPASDSWVEITAWNMSNLIIQPASFPSTADGTKVVAAIRAINKSGSENFSYSNGITLDSTKPYISDITLNDNKSYFSSHLLPARTGSGDTISDVERVRYRRGKYVGTEWIGWGEYVEVTDTFTNFNIDLHDADLHQGDRLYFEFVVTDSAGNDSLPKYSQAVTFNPVETKIVDLAGEYREGILQFSWAEAAGSLPNISYSIQLHKGSSVLEQAVIEGTVRSWQYATEDEGNYTFSLTATNEAGVFNANTSTLLVDISPPVISSMNVRPYVSTALGFNLLITDNISYSNEWKYRIGKIGFPGVLSAGWVSNSETKGKVDKEFMLSELPHGDSVADKDNLVVEVAARDRFGNWSQVIQGNISLVDLSPPENIAVTVEPNVIRWKDSMIEFDTRYLTSSTKMENIGLFAQDEESKVSGYRWLVKEAGDSCPGSDVAEFVTFETPVSRVCLEDLQFGGTVFEHGKEYQLYVSVLNQAGVYSEWITSPVVIADFEGATAAIQIQAPGQVGTDNQLERVVVNGAVNLSITIYDEFSEAVLSTARIFNSEMQQLAKSEQLVYLTEPMMTIPFVPEEERWGEYSVLVEMSDIAGNKTEENIFKIRYNAPPDMELPERIQVNPGRPFTLAAQNWRAQDPDGIADVLYLISGPGYSSSQRIPGTGPSDEFALLHAPARNQSTVYTLNCTATDALGQSSQFETIIEVVNTQEGRLYVNEYWGDGHRITGPVEVDNRIELTILSGARIECVGRAGDAASRPAGITIAEGASLVHEGTAAYININTEEGYWEGIRLLGNGSFSNVSISGATRALVVGPNSTLSDIRNSEFTHNQIGLHVLKSDIRIESSRFANNMYYGIKEDNHASPRIVSCRFSANGYAYYDTESTVLTVGEVNRIRRNYGNREE